MTEVSNSVRPRGDDGQAAGADRGAGDARRDPEGTQAPPRQDALSDPLVDPLAGFDPAVQADQETAAPVEGAGPDGAAAQQEIADIVAAMDESIGILNALLSNADLAQRAVGNLSSDSFADAAEACLTLSRELDQDRSYRDQDMIRAAALIDGTPSLADDPNAREAADAQTLVNELEDEVAQTMGDAMGLQDYQGNRIDGAGEPPQAGGMTSFIARQQHRVPRVLEAAQALVDSSSQIAGMDIDTSGEFWWTPAIQAATSGLEAHLDGFVGAEYLFLVEVMRASGMPGAIVDLLGEDISEARVELNMARMGLSPDQAGAVTEAAAAIERILDGDLADYARVTAIRRHFVNNEGPRREALLHAIEQRGLASRLAAVIGDESWDNARASSDRYGDEAYAAERYWEPGIGNALGYSGTATVHGVAGLGYGMGSSVPILSDVLDAHVGMDGLVALGENMGLETSDAEYGATVTATGGQIIGTGMQVASGFGLVGRGLSATTGAIGVVEYLHTLATGEDFMGRDRSTTEAAIGLILSVGNFGGNRMAQGLKVDAMDDMVTFVNGLRGSQIQAVFQALSAGNDVRQTTDAVHALLQDPSVANGFNAILSAAGQVGGDMHNTAQSDQASSAATDAWDANLDQMAADIVESRIQQGLTSDSAVVAEASRLEQEGLLNRSDWAMVYSAPEAQRQAVLDERIAAHHQTNPNDPNADLVSQAWALVDAGMADASLVTRVQDADTVRGRALLDQVHMDTMMTDHFDSLAEADAVFRDRVSHGGGAESDASIEWALVEYRDGSGYGVVRGEGQSVAVNRHDARILAHNHPARGEFGSYMPLDVIPSLADGDAAVGMSESRMSSAPYEQRVVLDLPTGQVDVPLVTDAATQTYSFDIPNPAGEDIHVEYASSIWQVRSGDFLAVLNNEQQVIEAITHLWPQGATARPGSQ